MAKSLCNFEKCFYLKTVNEKFSYMVFCTAFYYLKIAISTTVLHIDIPTLLHARKSKCGLLTIAEITSLFQDFLLSILMAGLHSAVLYSSSVLFVSHSALWSNGHTEGHLMLTNSYYAVRLRFLFSTFSKLSYSNYISVLFGNNFFKSYARLFSMDFMFYFCNCLHNRTMGDIHICLLFSKFFFIKYN